MSKKCTPLWREAHFEVKMYKTHQLRTTFGSWDVEKVHAVVARSTFRSEHVQNTRGADHFWQLRCRKSSAKHISKSKCTKHNMFAPLLEVQMSRCRLRGRRKGLCTLSKVIKTWGLCGIFNYNHYYSTLHSNTLHTLQLQLHLHYILLQYTPLHYTALNYTQLHYATLHYTTLHYTTLHYTTLPSTTLHYITLHSTTLQLQLHSTTLHYTKLHSTTLNDTTLHCTPPHDTTLHYTTRHYLPLHYITLHSTTLHYITRHYLPLHSTTLRYITLHYIYTEWHCTTDRQIDR